MPTTRRRLLATAIASLTLLFGATAFATSSLAAPYVETPELEVSSACPLEGATITVVGKDFVSGSNVTLTLHTDTFSLGSVIPDASGEFSTSVTLPSDVTGEHTIVAAGPPTATNINTASAEITICGVAEGGGGGSGGGGGGGGGLASTGVAVIGIGSLGVALLMGGGLVLMAGKRRRVSAA